MEWAAGWRSSPPRTNKQKKNITRNNYVKINKMFVGYMYSLYNAKNSVIFHSAIVSSLF